MIALQVENVTAGYTSADIVRNVTFQVPQGQTLAILGRNGVGKTTLLNTVVGLLRPRSGRISILEQDVGSTPTHRVARLGLAYGRQEANVFDELSVEQNLSLALRRKEKLGDLGTEIFQLFPVLAKRLRQRAGTLSGGERKMLVVARALIQQPKILLLDEVTEGVQPSIVDLIGAAIAHEATKGTTVVLVEQKLKFALRLASHVIVMKRGEIVLDETSATVAEADVAEHLVL